MTKKLFWDEPYRTELDTRIVTVDGGDVTVEETIFYALAGGQESDRGVIGGRPVLEALRGGLDIRYRLDPDHGLAAGDAVHMTIDWDRRYRLMRLHFAAEIVLELAYQTLGPIQKIGAHIAEDKARIDFLRDSNISSELPALQERARQLIEADHEIVSAFSDEESERRYWEVDGFARVPCGGTHPNGTGEVGPIALRRNNIGKGKERIEIRLAEPVSG